MIPATLTEGQPLLTMTSVTSLDDLAPFFATVCQSVTKQQTKSHNRREAKTKKAKPVQANNAGVVSSIIERDFLENLSA